LDWTFRSSIPGTGGTIDRMSSGGKAAMARPVALIIDEDPLLRDVNAIILHSAGYFVEVATPDGDAVAIAVKRRPQVILCRDHPAPTHSHWQVISRLAMHPKTSVIPIVLIVMAEKAASLPSNVRETVLAPYAVDALIAAVDRCRLPVPPELPRSPNNTAHEVAVA
jgi:CheY-like chemotaxis protein